MCRVLELSKQEKYVPYAYCLNCGEVIDRPEVFCSTDCQADYK